MASAKADGEANITPTSWAAANTPPTVAPPVTNTAAEVAAALAAAQASSGTSTAKTPSATTGGQVTPVTTGTGSTSSTSTSTPTGTTTGTTTGSTSTTGTTSSSASDSSTNVAAWYLNELGRLPSSTELAYWQNQLNSGADPQQLYQTFTQSAINNGETVTPTTWASANSYTPASASATTIGANATPVTLDPSTLDVRTVDPATETVAGQVNKLLDENSPVLQAAQAAAMRSAASRGMLNSAMASSAGTNAMIQNAENIGTTDANTYNAADNYNVAAYNQALLQNTSNAQALQQLQLQLQDSAASRANSLAESQLSAGVSEYNANLSANTSKYATDQNYQLQMQTQKNTLINAIINNMDLSPDRKAALLQSLGEGTSADNGTPSGLAGAVYVIGSTSSDLTGGTGTTGSTTGYSTNLA